MADLKTQIVHSLSDNPWYNLALEEYLLNQVGKSEVILYLWQNQNTVVIGRNQNAWKECRCKELEAEGGKLARRLSGGGAVFHDLGNLNFTFIVDRDLYNLEKQLEVILEAVRNLGIEAEFSGRNDLLVAGKKFSGNAFYFTADSAYHHGTILINTDFKKLVNYLQVSKEKIKAKGIESVPSRVVNLLELKPDLTIGKMKQAMEDSFKRLYGGDCEKQELNPTVLEELEDLYKKYSSWEWRYGQTPDFDIIFENRFSWGGIELGLKLKKGYIKEAVIYSDAMDLALIQEISSVLVGVPFKINDITSSIDRLATDSTRKEVIEDLKEWLSSKAI